VNSFSKEELMFLNASYDYISSENLMNTAKYCTMRRSKAKKLSAYGGFAPYTPLPGLCE